MSSILTVEDRRTDGPSRARPSAGRSPAARPVARDRRGPARPVSVAARGAAGCPSPVLGARTAPVPSGLVRRIGAGVGLVLASAAAVVGLGLLADASVPSASPAQPAVPSVGQP